MSLETSRQYLILDLGSHHIKAGYSGEGYPRFIIPSVVGYKKKTIVSKEAPLFGYDAIYESTSEKLRLTYPFQEITVSEHAEWRWEPARDLISHLINKLNISPPDYSVVYIEPLHANPNNTKRLTQLLKEKFGFPEVFVYNQAHLTIQELQRRTALVIELGHSFSSITAYYKGYELKPSTTLSLIAGRVMTEHFARQVEFEFVIPVTSYELSRVIDKHFYVAKDYEYEQKNYERGLVKDIEVNLPYSKLKRSLELGDQRFIIPEALFRPEVIRADLEGLGIALREAIMACPVDTRPELLENVILSGGLSKLNGIELRIRAELVNLFPNTKINILTHERQDVTAWIGADTLCTKGFPDTQLTHKRSLNFLLPEIVQQYYNEAVSCENAQLWLATLIVTQKTLETVISELTKQASSISTIITEFKNLGIISDSFLEWASGMKIFQNIDTPPKLKQYIQTSAVEELDFLQVLLEIVYEFYPKLRQR